MTSQTKDEITVKYKQLPEDNEDTIKKISFNDNCFTTPINLNSGSYNNYYCRTNKESYDKMVKKYNEQKRKDWYKFWE